MKKKNEPTIKADDFVELDIADGIQGFTNFQELEKKFEVLKDVVDELSNIIRENNLTREEIIKAPYFEEDEVYDRLDKEFDDDALHENTGVNK